LTGSSTNVAVKRPPSPGSVGAALSARSVSKTFRLPHEKQTTLKHRVLRPHAHRDHEVLEALDDVSFEVATGETFGIVGRNGSGKSTLLKCLSGIYRVDAGEIDVRGRLAPFIELGVGFNPELTARDNVVANAVLFGLSPGQARARFDEIIAFAELESFVDQKLKNFSSGMTLRLAFAVTTQVDADVLLFDEVLQVGDAAFGAKCVDYFHLLKAEGRTVVVVTHDMEAIERHCDRAMLLDRGRLVEIGDPDRIRDAYEAENFSPRAARAAIRDESPRWRRRARALRRSWARSTPLVVGGDLRRLGLITRTFAAFEFKLKYLDAALSYFWVLIKPLAFFGILYFVFSEIGNFDQGVTHYPIYLLCSLLLWLYFSEATTKALYSLVEREPLLRRVPFPHIAVPLSVVATALFDLFMSGIAVLVFILAAGIAPRLSWLEVLPIVVLYTMFVVGVAMLLSALYVRYRDVDHIWGLSRHLLFYASPIFYVATAFPEEVKNLMLASPLAAAYTEVRHAVIDPSAPSVVEANGGVWQALVPVAIVFVVFFVGLWVFHRESPTVAENV
jgi:ABC-type polysaccharide/polyol phosphate transport system ATPase subunit/ABC-type polysaccharide/polyol phosphate export permease